MFLSLVFRSTLVTSLNLIGWIALTEKDWKEEARRHFSFFPSLYIFFSKLLFCYNLCLSLCVSVFLYNIDLLYPFRKFPLRAHAHRRTHRRGHLFIQAKLSGDLVTHMVQLLKFYSQDESHMQLSCITWLWSPEQSASRGPFPGDPYIPTVRNWTMSVPSCRKNFTGPYQETMTPEWT